MSTGLSYCASCNNLMYPKVDTTNHVLLMSCRSCQYQEEAENTMVYRHDLKLVSKENPGVVDGLPNDPTLPRSQEYPCPECLRSDAVTFQDQGKRANNRMILFYVCTACNHVFSPVA